MQITGLDDLKKDAKLLAAALKFAKRNLHDENLLFYFAKGDPRSIYLRYLDRRASKMVNLPSKLSQPMNDMAKAGDWNNAAWTGKLKDARESINGLWVTDCLPRFRTSDELWELRKPAITKNMEKVAELLGIKNKELLMKAMESVSRKDNKSALKLLGMLGKDEALKDGNQALLKHLEKQLKKAGLS